MPAKRRMKSHENKEDENLLLGSTPLSTEDMVQTIFNFLEQEIKQEVKQDIDFEDPKDPEGWSPQEMGNAIDIFNSEGSIRTPIFASLEPNCEARPIEIMKEKFECICIKIRIKHVNIV